MMFRVLVTAPHLVPEIDRFRPRFDAHGIVLVVPPLRMRRTEDELLGLVDEIDGVICGDDAFTARVIAAARKLKVISKWGVGIDAIDQAACARAGITVKNTPALLAGPVADTVLGYILCFARQLPQMDRAMKQGRWERRPARALSECALGIVGVGSIGRAVAVRAAASGMRVLGTDVVPVDADLIAHAGIAMVPLERLLVESDFVSLNCTLTDASYHLIGAPELALMKPQAVLINTARGALVDEPALIAALESRRIAGAALDVFEVEPLPEDSPLRRIEQVMLGPHAANTSPAAWAAIHEQAVANLLDGLLEKV